MLVELTRNAYRLWQLTRHSNYLGDACVWRGVWLAAA
ncbi:DUF1295 domain-containing protein [Dietzia aurantiaca]|uniref:DUF1295 domain-containing protein n=1 Tax=Dietzia aurantiaca TaxID=983873 RepID=A0ABV9PMW0_9ACTN